MQPMLVACARQLIEQMRYAFFCSLRENLTTFLDFITHLESSTFPQKLIWVSNILKEISQMVNILAFFCSCIL